VYIFTATLLTSVFISSVYFIFIIFPYLELYNEDIQIPLKTFYYQLTHTTLKNVELLKYSKIDKNVPTCFGLHGNYLQGAKVSTWLKVTRLVNSRCVKDVQGLVNAMAAYCDCNKGYVWNM